MSVLDQAQLLVREGRAGDAAALVESAADRGDVEALLALAHWRLFGLFGPRDLPTAHACFAKAARNGSAEAARIQAALIGSGTGVARDIDKALSLLRAAADRDPLAAQQVDFLTRHAPSETADSPNGRTLSEDPLVKIVERLFSREECDYLIARSEPQLRPSFVIDPRTKRPAPHPVRTSDGMNFGPTEEDPVVHILNRRLAWATGTDVECGEPLHILRYRPGQEYRPHVDLLPAADNQREWTVLVYLNDGYAGGETRFEDLGFAHKGGVGDALVFRNVDADGEDDMRTRHCGLPVTSGVKWLASRWIRRAPPGLGLGPGTSRA